MFTHARATFFCTSSKVPITANSSLGDYDKSWTSGCLVTSGHCRLSAGDEWYFHGTRRCFTSTALSEETVQGIANAFTFLPGCYTHTVHVISLLPPLHKLARVTTVLYKDWYSAYISNFSLDCSRFPLCQCPGVPILLLQQPNQWILYWVPCMLPFYMTPLSKYGEIINGCHIARQV